MKGRWWQYYQGIALSVASWSEPGYPLYSIRVGRNQRYVRAEQLPPEWLTVYVRWHQRRGELEAAESVEVASRPRLACCRLPAPATVQ